ncbi:MAG: transporter [Mesoaciditoga sp.]|uniref:queuosine precursor transporter n=1 Tax=Athalassotoga sp. TaxID=2022597 RepID=UPI000CB13395|nr:MAG: transporter [Mesoaciditoga sp.]PMP80469.1 MAG: transporter [Mesoaciditoga sp.]HEU24727.1 VUT family protein [Mesoaciditoga lauensis]
MEERKITPLYVFLAVVFVTCLIIANVTAGRLVNFWGIVLPGAVLIFPISYIFGDILTEVYGFRRSRLVIWLGLGANLFMAFFFLLINALPAPAWWQTEANSYSIVLGLAPRAVISSVVAYFVGEYLNSVVMSKMKILTKGKFLWTRTIGSTVVGEGADTLIFIIGTFAGLMNLKELFFLILAQYIFKVAYETIATPLTYLIVFKIKKIEKMDTYDYGERYNPVISKEDF